MLQFTVLPEIVTATKKRFLDIACGFGKWGRFIKEGSYASYSVGLDIWRPYLTKIKEQHIYADLILADATSLPFKERSFDVVVACEVIEHLSRMQGNLMRIECERIACEKVVLSTPNYNYEQHAVRGNPFEEHVSFWKDSDFKKAGYKVRGISFRILDRFNLSGVPIFGKCAKRLVMPKMFSCFAEFVVGTKLQPTCLSE
jgi:ubiquinone/menaquinone biosynthesis C-methylase UbiE